METTIYVDGPESWRGRGVGQGSGEIFDRAQQVAGPAWELTYAEYSHTLGAFGIKLGGRYEYTWQDIDYKKGPAKGYATRYGTFVPAASLQYTLAPASNIGLTYNVRISRPGISYLNPFVDVSNPTHHTYGNPDLDVAKSHNFSLVYNFYSPKIILSATLGHELAHDGIADYTFSENNILKTTRMYANGGVSYQDNRSQELDYSKEFWSFNLMLGAQQTLFWDLRLSENLMIMPKRYTLQGWTSGINFAILSITKTFLEDRLSVSVTGVSHLDTSRYMKFEMVSEGHGYASKTQVDIPVRQAMIAISWSFGKSGIKVKKTDRTIKNDDILEKEADTAASGKLPSGM